MNVVEMSDVSKVYLDFWHRPITNALSHLSLSVKSGSIFGLLGPNGSGKSTAIKLILGLIRPTGGEISVLGRMPQDRFVKEKVGYLPELSNLHKFLTPRETLEYYAGLFGLEKRVARRRIEELLVMVGLEDDAKRAIGGFSKGMARRVAVAQALINNPEFVIFDEPTSGLDPVAARAVKDWTRELSKAGKTILMTSHLLADVEDLCDEIAIICDGTLRASGRLEELLGVTREAESRKLKLEGYFLNVVEKAGGSKRELSNIAPFLTEKEGE